MRPPAPNRPGAPVQPLTFNPICLDDHASAPSAATEWLWHGIIAAGQLTLFTSQWKTGKTTLLSVLLARMRAGGAFLRLPVASAPAIVVSEEHISLWRQRRQLLDFGPHLHIISRPFVGKPSFAQWAELVDRLVELHADGRPRLFVIDTIASLFPAGVENNPDCMQRALGFLRKLTDRRTVVWLFHHPPKGKTLFGQLARGNGTVLASVDISLELYTLKNASPDDRRRLLLGYSRHKETPRQLLIEWTADGTDYLVLSAKLDEDFLRGWRPLRIVLEDADTKLCRQDILDSWPPDYVAPSKVTLWRWLDRAVEEGLVLREGLGRCHDPYRYFLAEKLPQWLNDPLQFLDEPDMHALAMKRANDREQHGH